MSEFRISSRYAKSLLGLAQEKKELEEVHNDMLLFRQIAETNRDFVLMLKNPIIKHDKKLKILTILFSGRINKLTLSFFKILTRKGREKYLPAISREFHYQYNQVKQIEVVEITTTFKLDEELRTKFKDIVKSSIKKEVELIEIVDPELLGGFIIKIGDRQVDDSLKSKLKELELSFTADVKI